MRERSTWNRTEIAKKAAAVDGDVYSMNQDHPQPAADEYVIGDPSDFAEDVHAPNTWEQEYSGDGVARNEIGLPEMRKDTFNHPEKTASDRVRLKKAELCVAVAKLMLADKRVASSDAVEDQAVALMYMPDQELISTHMRLAEDQDADDDDEEEEVDEGQEKQAADDDDGDDDEADEGQEKQAADDDDDGAFEEDDDEGQEKQAQKQAQDQTPDDVKNEGGDQNAKANQNKQAKIIARLKKAMGEQQQLLSQIQQELQQQQVGQQQVQLDQVGQQQQLQQLDQQQVGQGDLDQMLADDECGPLAEQDIQMDAPAMDVGQTVLAGEDEILRTLFAQDQEQDDEEEEAPPPFEKKQARTASTRTVGTRPRQGVARLGGSVSKTASTSVTDKLSSLWQSAPDVRDAFGLK